MYVCLPKKSHALQSSIPFPLACVCLGKWNAFSEQLFVVFSHFHSYSIFEEIFRDSSLLDVCTYISDAAFKGYLRNQAVTWSSLRRNEVEHTASYLGFGSWGHWKAQAWQLWWSVLSWGWNQNSEGLGIDTSLSNLFRGKNSCFNFCMQ